MPINLNIECCEGNENYDEQCLKLRCPVYRDCRNEVDSSWPRMPTGFGNVYGEPNHGHYMSAVKDKLKIKLIKPEDRNVI